MANPNLPDSASFPPNEELKSSDVFSRGPSWKEKLLVGLIAGGATLIQPYDVRYQGSEVTASEPDKRGTRTAVQAILKSLVDNHNFSKKNYPDVQNGTAETVDTNQTVNIDGKEYSVKRTKEAIADTDGTRKVLYSILYEGREYVVGINAQQIAEDIRAKLRILAKRKGEAPKEPVKKADNNSIKPIVRQASAETKYPSLSYHNHSKGLGSHTRAPRR